VIERRINVCKSPRNRFYNWLLALFGGGAVAAAVFYMSLLTPTPARVITFKDPRVVGKDLVVDFRVVMNQKCDAMVAWWILDKEENAVLLSDTTPARPLRVGVTDITAKRELPEKLAPGEYVYKALVFDHCADKKLYTSGVRVPFTVK
jgi:hypothetical protein